MSAFHEEQHLIDGLTVTVAQLQHPDKGHDRFYIPTDSDSGIQGTFAVFDGAASEGLSDYAVRLLGTLPPEHAPTPIELATAIDNVPENILSGRKPLLTTAAIIQLAQGEKYWLDFGYFGDTPVVLSKSMLTSQNDEQVYAKRGWIPGDASFFLGYGALGRMLSGPEVRLQSMHARLELPPRRISIGLLTDGLFDVNEEADGALEAATVRGLVNEGATAPEIMNAALEATDGELTDDATVLILTRD